MPRIDAGRDGQRTRVGVVHHPRADVVSQSLLLADGQEQPAAHPVAKDRVQHAKGPRVGMVATEGRNPDHEMGLAGVPMSDQEALAGGQGRGGIEGAYYAVAAAEGSPGKLHALLVGEVAGHGDHDVGGPVGTGPEVPDRAFGQCPNTRLVPADLAAQGADSEHGLLKEDLGVFGGVVEVRADLLDDDRPLVADLAVRECRPHDELTEHSQGSLQLARGHAHPVDGGFAIGRRVEAAADALDRLGDRSRRRIGRRALEGDVLHEMGDAGLVRQFKPRSRQHVRGD